MVVAFAALCREIHGWLSVPFCRFPGYVPPRPFGPVNRFLVVLYLCSACLWTYTLERLQTDSQICRWTHYEPTGNYWIPLCKQNLAFVVSIGHILCPVHNLGTTLQQLLDLQHRSQRQFATACGFAHGTIRKIIAGRRCSPEVLRLICQHISNEPRVRYELLLAHLRDEVVRSGLDPSHVIHRYTDGADLGQLSLPQELGVYLGIIARESAVNPSVRDQLAALAELILRFRGEIHDSSRASTIGASDIAKAN